MATCVTFGTGGALPQTGEAFADCTGYVLLDALEYADTPTLSALFTQPVAADLAQLWALGFSLPLTIYLVAWGFGVVINWFKPDHERD